MKKGEIIIDDRDTLEETAAKYTPEEIEQLYIKIFGHKPGEEPKEKNKSGGKFIIHYH